MDGGRKAIISLTVVGGRIGAARVGARGGARIITSATVTGRGGGGRRTNTGGGGGGGRTVTVGTTIGGGRTTGTGRRTGRGRGMGGGGATMIGGGRGLGRGGGPPPRSVTGGRRIGRSIFGLGLGVTTRKTFGTVGIRTTVSTRATGPIVAGGALGINGSRSVSGSIRGTGSWRSVSLRRLWRSLAMSRERWPGFACGSGRTVIPLGRTPPTSGSSWTC